MIVSSVTPAKESPFEKVMQEHSPRVMRSLRYLGVSESDLPDASQEVFLVVHRRLQEFRGDASLSTWIYSIARNTALTALQSASGHRTLSLEEPAIRIAAEDRQQECVAPSRAGFDVTAMIAQLPSRYGQVIRLYYMQDKSYDEVARLLDIPMGTVKTLLHRARKELATALAQSTVKGG